jgi:hypothetical protein
MTRCTAHSQRTHEPCRQPAVPGRTVCAYHGGKSPRGLASPHWKSGRYSRALPHALTAAYERVCSGPELLGLRDELALVDARMNAVLQGLAASGDAAADKAWAEIYETIELRRRLVDTECKRLETLRTSIPAEEALAMVAALAASVKRHISDRAILAAITADIEQVLGRVPKTQ